MKYVWQDLPKPLNCFTIRSAVLRNLNTGEIIQHYSANTKIVVVQKCVTESGTYYRTASAEHHYLNFAFEASALGLPNEIASPAPSHSFLNSTQDTGSLAAKTRERQKTAPKRTSSKGEEKKSKFNFFSKLFKK